MMRSISLTACLCLSLCWNVQAQDSFKQLRKEFKAALEDGNAADAAALVPRLLASGDKDALELLLDDGLDSGDARVFDAIRQALDPLDAAAAKAVAKQAAKGSKVERAFLVELLAAAQGEDAVKEARARVLAALRDKDPLLNLAGIAANLRLQIDDARAPMRRLLDADNLLVAEAAQHAELKLAEKDVPEISYQHLLPQSFTANKLMVLVDISEAMFERFSLPAPPPAEGETPAPAQELSRLELVAAELHPLLNGLPPGCRFRLGSFARAYKQTAWERPAKRAINDALEWLKGSRKARQRDLDKALHEALADEELDGLLLVVAGPPDRGKATDYDELRQRFRQLCFQRPLKLCVVSASPALDPDLTGPDLLKAQADRRELEAFLQGLAEDNGGAFHKGTLGAPPVADAAAAPADGAMTAADSVAAGLYAARDFEIDTKRGEITAQGIKDLEQLLADVSLEAAMMALDGLTDRVDDKRFSEWLHEQGIVHSRMELAERCRTLLGSTSDSERRDDLARALDEERGVARQLAMLQVVRGFPVSELLVREVAKLAGSRAWAVRLGCVGVLRTQGSEAARDALDKLLRHEAHLRVARAAHDALKLLGGEPRKALPEQTSGPILAVPVASSRVLLLVDSSAALDESLPDIGSALPAPEPAAGAPEDAPPADSGVVPSISKRAWLQREVGAILAGWDKQTEAGMIELSRAVRRIGPVKMNREGHERLDGWLKKLDTADRRELLKALDKALDDGELDRIVIVLAGSQSPSAGTDAERMDAICRRVWDSGVRVDAVCLFARDDDLAAADYQQLAREQELAPTIEMLTALTRWSGGQLHVAAPLWTEDEESE